MGVEENKQIVRSFYEAGNRGDFDACFELISNDIVWTNIGSTRLSGTYRGKAELLEKLIDPLFGQLKAGISSTIERIFGEDDYVIALTSGTAETTDGRPTAIDIVRLFDFETESSLKSPSTLILR